jgi:Ca2+-transporting ATPase
MITGDHKDTAVAIARDLGIITDASQAIEGADLDDFSDEELKEAVAKYSVYARVQPEHKTRIVKAWKARGMVTAMTGDGVNDAPSIKAADIGVGMGITGTAVTKGVSDMVLADDNFATIVHAVEEGRKIYANVRKVLQFHRPPSRGDRIDFPLPCWASAAKRATVWTISSPTPRRASLWAWKHRAGIMQPSTRL